MSETPRPALGPHQKTQRFLRLVSARSEAYLNGDAWVKSRLTDLKIDLWLATEHGEGEGSEQADWLHAVIDLYEGIFRKTLFDPDPKDLDGGLAIQAAAADLGQYALGIARARQGDERTLVRRAADILEEPDARDLAAECMRRVSHHRGIVCENTDEVIERARHLLGCCR